jgi:DNA-binding transcriptional MerR regulator
MPRKLLTTAEVAERLRKPVSTLRYYRHIGIGPRSARVGRTVVYDEADVDAWVDEQFSLEGGD